MFYHSFKNPEEIAYKLPHRDHRGEKHYARPSDRLSNHWIQPVEEKLELLPFLQLGKMFHYSLPRFGYLPEQRVVLCAAQVIHPS